MKTFTAKTLTSTLVRLFGNRTRLFVCSCVQRPSTLTISACVRARAARRYAWTSLLGPSSDKPLRIPPPLQVSSAILMARSLLVLAALLALGAQGEMGKYGCHFDCYMTEEKASARGYLEYACNSTDNSTEGDNCCEPDLCLVAANELYRGKLCPAVPSNDSWSPNGFSQFQVGLDATARLGFPRNNFPCDGYLCNASLNHRTCSPLRHVCYGAGCDSLTSNSSHFIS
jgi:hypothetical protein